MIVVVRLRQDRVLLKLSFVKSLGVDVQMSRKAGEILQISFSLLAGLAFFARAETSWITLTERDN